MLPGLLGEELGRREVRKGLVHQLHMWRAKVNGLGSVAWAWYWVEDGRVEELE
jgi:hypothetical protein